MSIANRLGNRGISYFWRWVAILTIFSKKNRQIEGCCSRSDFWHYFFSCQASKSAKLITLIIERWKLTIFFAKLLREMLLRTFFQHQSVILPTFYFLILPLVVMRHFIAQNSMKTPHCIYLYKENKVITVILLYFFRQIGDRL